MNASTTTATGDGLNTKDRVAASLRQMVDEADQLLKSAADSGDAKFDQTRVRIEHELRMLRMQLDELQESTLHRARQAARRADETVHSHPYGAMAAAGALGLLAGLLLARR